MARGSLSRGDVAVISLDPTVGSEIRKRRPCVVVAPDELNDGWNTVLVAPLTSRGKDYPFRISCQFRGIQGLILLDQLRVVDRERIVREAGRLDSATLARVLSALQEMFAP